MADFSTLILSFDPFTLVCIGLFAFAVVITLAGVWHGWRTTEENGGGETPLLLLSLIVNVSPLLGLLGTLVGLGVAFAASAEHSLAELLSGAAVAINSSVAGVFASVTAAVGQAVLSGLEDTEERHPFSPRNPLTRSQEGSLSPNGQREEGAPRVLQSKDDQRTAECQEPGYADSSYS